MAFAYFMGHAPNGFLPIVNKGELAVIYCWFALYLAAAGPGAWALDGMRRFRATAGRAPPSEKGTPMPYVDGFVLPVPRKNLAAYRRIAAKAGRIWKEYGALEYRECVGDDLRNNWAVAFPRLAKVKPGETVVFSWIVYKSRAHRDRVNKKVMKDPRMGKMMDPTKMLVRPQDAWPTAASR